jgi:hypothetical protein
MKSLFFSFISILFVFTVNAQGLHLDLFAGTSNYQGDLQDKGFTFNQAHFAGGIGFSYDLSDHFSLKTGVVLGKISANDKFGKNKIRNLNFTSQITEWNLEVLYYITPLYQHLLTPYLFSGIAVYHFDPYTYDSTGKKYYLKYLSTEGEGFIPGKKYYSLTQMSIPFGAGVKMPLSQNINVGLEVGIRRTFTDYLDDVSGTYVDENLLLANRGSKAVELAYRGDEIKNGSKVYPAAGSQRGSPAKDMYYFTGFTLSFRLGSNSGNGRGNSQWSCPKNVL